MKIMSEIGVKISEQARTSIGQLRRNRWDKIDLSTSQIRKFLAGVNSLRNKVQVLKSRGEIDDRLTDEVLMEIDYLKIKLVYQCGESSVRDFVEKTQLFKMIDKIGSSYKRFNQFCYYVEALVAYHKFEGGN